ncbi:hypothetical protein QG37_07186 [Candidozyma auris]|uniref:Uncharacterized protein n=1 Tax=Candidozyma auris TaxID=498019 RepID=A0A0L0NQZ8_CANAR|nr:hypothetical protein QG37_07186 [[Candida] auris]
MVHRIANGRQGPSGYMDAKRKLERIPLKISQKLFGPFEVLHLVSQTFK